MQRPKAKSRWVNKRRRRWALGLVLAAFAVWYAFALPRQLFTVPYSTVLEDRQGQLLGASIATDGQWRFPLMDSLPNRFVQCLLYFEDEHFYRHPGVNPMALGRAIQQNIKARRVVSGGSTLSMQVIRLMRKNRQRTYTEKLLEMTLATRLELRHSKQDILRFYAAHAPFGGNVVGLDAASWRYFGRSAHKLSWAEAAAMAVLPNAPALVFPGKNEDIYLRKRNGLLQKLWQKGVIDSLTCALAKIEPLPGAPKRLPQLAPHLLDRARADGLAQQRIQSTIQAGLQRQVTQVLQRAHEEQLAPNGVFNGAVLVLDVATGQTLAYVGNTQPADVREHQAMVDCVVAPRSSGSILKPFLYAGMLQEGALLPKMLLPDVPVITKGFAPQNFSKEFDGAVPAHEALSRSLNLPAVHMLREYGVEKLLFLLRRLGLGTVNQPAGHYGLTLVLGGAEVRLWDICQAYAGMARSLNGWFKKPGQMPVGAYEQGAYVLPKKPAPAPEFINEADALFDAGVLWQTFRAMQAVTRPEGESNWWRFESARNVAWKTGTSIGFRDAWAVGLTRRYVVGVWVGNADGEGRPDLTGVRAAAPVLFNVFDLLPRSPWYERPQNMPLARVCRETGFLMGPDCAMADTVALPRASLRGPTCPYHQTVHLDPVQNLQVNSLCQPPSQMRHVSQLVLPPIMEWYYRQKHPDYTGLPPYRADCQPQANVQGAWMDLIYPPKGSSLLVPRLLNGTDGMAVLEVAHRRPEAVVHWHLDQTYLGSTQAPHKMGVQPTAGTHQLRLVDDAGQVFERRFEVSRTE